ncbi:hypothetical protein HNP21_006295 [Bacillus aryabhattai]|uniref:Helix-turn-helix domain-containing protein n=1 Tax=Priestia aryabhattai TaxID=412384 RepID=A0A7W3NHJ8_PRIAR|nr:hypothetical protein [Priestia aryabhattai]MBA9043117.1 hypothetical protein [Priestia aryabhattai]
MLSDRTKIVIQTERVALRIRQSDLMNEMTELYQQQIYTAFSSTPEEDKQREEQLKEVKKELKEITELLEWLNTNPLENVFSIDEASRAWGMTEEFLESLCSNKTIKAIKVGNKWLVDTLQSNPKVNLVK